MLIPAHAKMNLILDLGPKGVNGRYATQFIMQEIDLHDDILVEPHPGEGIILECQDPTVPTDERNLCHQAARLMQELSARTDGLHIVITKRIPSAGGLGGGSSDAAAVIKQLNQLWHIDISDEALIRALNRKLGTDASFFIKGGTAEVRENGLSVTPIATSLQLPLIFVVPDIQVPADKTASIYDAFDPLKVTERPDIHGMRDALHEGSLPGVAQRLFNAFEYSLPKHYRAIPAIKKELIEMGCLGAIMCGAGPTVFGICEDETHARRIASALKDRHPLCFLSKSHVPMRGAS